MVLMDMEKPVQCISCPMWTLENIRCHAVDVCRQKKMVIENPYTVQKWCPIKKLPPHGRLIDADALTISAAVPLDGKPYQYVHIDNIKVAPTIIPADDPEEES